MKKIIIWLIGVALLGLSVPTLAVGTDAGSFVRDGIGARAFALGGAFVAIADDASAGFWNPAGIGYMTGYHLGSMYVLGGRFNISDVKFQDLSLLAKPVQTGSFSGLGVGITWINHSISGSLDDSTLSDDISLFLVSLAWPFKIGDWSLSTGANVKYYLHVTHAGAISGVANGLGFDLGVLVHTTVAGVPLSFGIVSLDTAETVIKWHGTQHNPTNYVPWLMKGGASVLLLDSKLRVSTDVDFAMPAVRSGGTRHYDLDRVHLGVEVTPIEQLILRGGIIVWRDGTTRLSAGVGLKPWQGITVDYAYIHGEQGSIGGDTHVLSASFSFPQLKLTR